MSDPVQKFEFHRQQLASSLAAVAESMRNCAQLADTFAKVVVDIQYSPEEATPQKSKGKRRAALLPEDGEAPKKRKRITKPKDPNAPKKPASAYLVFQNEVRHELKSQHPELTNPEILSLISEQWKKMTPEQKETYYRIVEKAKAQYSKEKKAYDSRNLAESQATDVAVEADTTPQKEGTKPRGPKPGNATGSAPGTSAATAARPPASKVSGVSPSSESSDDEESEDDGPRIETEQPAPDSDSSEEESEQEKPSPKKRRTGSTQPKSQKAKKPSKV